MPLLARTARLSFPENEKENNLVSKSARGGIHRGPAQLVCFSRPISGWIVLSAKCQGSGTVTVVLDDSATANAVINHRVRDAKPAEGVRYVKQGEHHVHVACDGAARVERLVVKAIPELIHSGLGFDPAIKSFGHYDMEFSQTGRPAERHDVDRAAHLKLPQSVVDDWHRQGKRFIVEFGIDAKAKTAEEHAAYWAGSSGKVAVCRRNHHRRIHHQPADRFRETLAPLEPAERRRVSMPKNKRSTTSIRIYEKAIKQLRADRRLKDKALYFYFGGSGNTLNQEIIGPTIDPHHSRLPRSARTRTLHFRATRANSGHATRCASLSTASPTGTGRSRGPIATW